MKRTSYFFPDLGPSVQFVTPADLGAVPVEGTGPLTDEELDELEHTHPNHIPRSLCRRAAAEIRRARSAGVVVCS